MRVIDYLNDTFEIVQDTDCYRFTSDSILLSRFVRAKKGEVVADFCAGSGIVGFNFLAENEIASLTLFEAQEEMFSLSKETIARNAIENKVTAECVRVQDIPERYAEYFSLILCNPPYEKGGFENANEKKAPCRKELTLTLQELVEAAKRCLKFGGRFVLCHRADRMAELFYTLHGANLEPKRCRLVSGRRGKNPYLVLVEAVKGGKAGLTVLPEQENV